MSLFDLIGLLGSFIIRGKILLQNIWKVEIPWNKKLKITILKDGERGL